MKVNVIGLGLKSGDISLLGYKKLKKVDKVFVRSEKLSSFKILKNEGLNYVAFDEQFENAQSFEEVYKNIAQILSSEEGEIAYLTDGEGTQDKVLQYLDCQKEFFPAASKCARIVDGKSYTLLSAYDFVAIKNPSGTLSTCLYITDVDNKFIASEVKIKLGDLLKDEDEVVFYDGKTAQDVPLFEIDRQKKYDYNTGIMITFPHFLHKNRFTFGDLADIVSALRAPDGCPWDREQTHKSIRMSTIEEAYEVAEAIDLESPEKLVEETGDLMLQTVLHADIARDCGEYDLADVITELCRKLIDRHTHVFGKDKANDGAAALDTWEKNKALLKNEKQLSEAIDNVPKTLPAIMYAEKVAKKVSKYGLDFENVEQIFQKIEEELGEVKEALKDKDNLKEEMGDLLFSVCNLARFVKVEGEESLTFSTKKFIKRALKTEELIVKDGKEIKKLSPLEIDGYYLAAKKEISD